jgi:hypothetical protein
VIVKRRELPNGTPTPVLKTGWRWSCSTSIEIEIAKPDDAHRFTLFEIPNRALNICDVPDPDLFPEKFAENDFFLLFRFVADHKKDLTELHGSEYLRL